MLAARRGKLLHDAVSIHVARRAYFCAASRRPRSLLRPLHPHFRIAIAVAGDRHLPGVAADLAVLRHHTVDFRIERDLHPFAATCPGAQARCAPGMGSVYWGLADTLIA